jgi:hypothetical protein
MTRTTVMTDKLSRLHPGAPLFFCRSLLFIVLGLSAAPIAAETVCSRPMVDVMPLIEEMERSWSEVSDYTAFLLKTERFVDGVVIEERAFIRFRKPDQFHLRVLEGADAGAELLFPKPGTDSVVLGRPGGVSGAVAGFLVKVPAIGRLIPYEFNLYEGRLIDGQHHPLPDSTIGGMMHLISVNVRKAARRLEGSVCFHPGEVVDGKRAIKIEVRLPSDAGFWHTVAEGETLWTIGEDYGQDRYVIRYNNPSLNPDKSLPAGDRIFVPRYYAPRAVIWVSESSHLPLKMQIFDVEGRLYEDYSNVDLRIDVGLSDADFDPVLHGFPAVTTSGTASSEIGTRTR